MEEEEDGGHTFNWRIRKEFFNNMLLSTAWAILLGCGTVAGGIAYLGNRVTSEMKKSRNLLETSKLELSKMAFSISPKDVPPPEIENHHGGMIKGGVAENYVGAGSAIQK